MSSGGEIDWEEFAGKLLKPLLGLVFLVCIATFYRGCCVTFVDSYELGFRYDKRTGQMMRLNQTGYIQHLPFLVDVDVVDLRPMQVCINSNSRVLNCKLVQFDPAGLETFIAWHGRADYSSTGNLADILRSYAYDGSGKTYPFLIILRELKSDDHAASASSSGQVIP